jgi:hypothetical protein
MVQANTQQGARMDWVEVWILLSLFVMLGIALSVGLYLSF